MKDLKRLWGSFCGGVKHICGRKKFTFKLLGIPWLTVRERDRYHLNVFILFLPLLQIVTGPKAHMLNILLLVWLMKTVKYLFTGWSFVNRAEVTRFAFCGRTIYEKRVIEPYRFLSTTFRDKQVGG